MTPYGEAGAVEGLPMYLLVSLVAGAAVLAAIWSVLPTPPRPFTVAVEGAWGCEPQDANAVIQVCGTGSQAFHVDVRLRAARSSEPLEGASVVVSGPEGGAGAVSDASGLARVAGALDWRTGALESTMSVEVSAPPPWVRSLRLDDLIQVVVR